MKLWKSSLAALMCVVLTACAGSTSYQQARDEEAVGHWDLAVMRYAQALEMDPKNSTYKIALERAKLKASQIHFEKGKMYRASGRPDLAVVEFAQTVLLDPTNDYAEIELRKAEADVVKQEAERLAETRMESLKKKTKGARAVTPMLEPSSDRPINLNFPQPKPIKQIYRALADAAGINVVFDPQLKDDNVSIVLSSIEFQKALETLIRQENHFYKIIDEKSILIAADTPQNRKTYEDLVIRTFFLSNADVTEVANALRALLQTTRISVNKAENSITLRDTSDKVAVAERIVEQNDKQVAEVVVDVELLQINTTKAQNLGIQLVPRAVGATIPSPGTGVTNLGATVANGFTWDQLQQIGIKSFGFTIPSVVLTFIKDNSDAELLAKPQLRIAEGQKAQLLIGDRVPIPVSSFNTSNVSGSNVVPITSYQYQDIGIKIEVEPRVHHNKEVTLKLMTEVSNIAGYAPTTQGQQPQPIIGTRTISSNIRLRDGETNFLAGLYRTDKSNAKETIPFIGDIPVIGRIFSRVNTDDKTTDLVLTLTPHIIRIPDITEEDLTPVYVGTDSNISYQGGPRVENPNRDAGPFEQQPGGRTPPMQRTPAPAAQPPQNPGINLAPGGAPSDIFRAPTQPPSNPPQTQVPPQPKSGQNAAAGSEPVSAAAATLSAVDNGTPVLLDFDPAFLTLGVGQQQTILVRATSPGGFPGGTLRVRFDPSVAAAISVRPVLTGGNGVASGSVSGSEVILELPDSADLSGTRAVAEITLRGVTAGRGTVAFQPVEMPGAEVTFSTAVVDVR
jgi:general secretion pathway protein D